MSNYDRATQIIYDEVNKTWERGEILTAAGEAERLAKALAQAGLLAPDLPERPDDGVWGELGQFLVDTAENDGVAVAPPHPGVVTLTSKEARETALALLAASTYKEEE